MYGIRIEPIAATAAVDRSARAISARSRRTAAAETRAHWTAQDERAEQQRSVRTGPGARPVLTLVHRA